MRLLLMLVLSGFTLSCLLDVLLRDSADTRGPEDDPRWRPGPAR